MYLLPLNFGAQFGNVNVNPCFGCNVGTILIQLTVRDRIT